MVDPANLIVSSLLEKFVEAVVKQIFHARLPKGRRQETVSVSDMEEFWEDPKGQLSEGSYVSIYGQLSLFAPTMFGSPKSKRELHLDIRRKLVDITRRLKKKPYPIAPTTLDALLGYTAGQMVFRPQLRDSRYVYLGLYHSIVRNSIPVFVERSYFDREVLPLFSRGQAAAVRECRVTGRLRAIVVDYLNEVFDKSGLKRIYNVELSAPKKQFAIEVNGETDGSLIDRLGKGKARYLDGDIWVAVRTTETERVVSRFLNLSDQEDLQSQRLELRKEVETLFAKASLISQFDEVQRVFLGTQIVDSTRIAETVLSASSR